MNAMSHAPPQSSSRAQMGHRINDQIGITKFGSTSTTYFTGSGAGINVDLSGNLDFVS